MIKRVANDYNSGKPELRRTRHRQYRWSSAHPFDRRNLSWDHEAQTISIWTVDGRKKQEACPVRMRFRAAGTSGLVPSCPIGESDLVFRSGTLYLHATIEIEDKPLNESSAGWLGVDLGIVNQAVTSDGNELPEPIKLPAPQTKKGKSTQQGSEDAKYRPNKQGAGSHVNSVCYRNLKLRSKPQKKGTRSAKRLLAKRSGKEARFARDVNHRISKTIVTEAERTGRGIARENLEGIRNRARFRNPQRVALHSWSFHQLGAFIDYKAERRAGVPVVAIDPAYTSQQCSGCGRIHSKNRPNGDTFKCTGRSLSLPADLNAAINIALRGEECWAVSHAATRHTDFPTVA